MSTIRRPWIKLRSVVATDTALAAATMDSKPDEAIDISSQDIDSIEIIGAGNGADGESFVATIYGGRGDGPARRIATLTFTLGTAVVNQDPVTGEDATPTLYADTVVVTNQYWVKDVEISNDQGSNGIATAWFDAWGLDWISAKITTLTGVGDNVSLYISHIGTS